MLDVVTARGDSQLEVDGHLDLRTGKLDNQGRVSFSAGSQLSGSVVNEGKIEVLGEYGSVDITGDVNNTVGEIIIPSFQLLDIGGKFTQGESATLSLERLTKPLFPQFAKSIILNEG